MSRLSNHLKLGFPLGEQPLPTDQLSATVESDESAADTVSRAASAAVAPQSASAQAQEATSVAVTLPSESDADIAPGGSGATID